MCVVGCGDRTCFCRLAHILLFIVCTFKVLGVIRCPLYTLPNGLGFPAFLKHRFIADGKDQLLHVIREKELLSQNELTTALKNCDLVKTLVTVQDADV